MISKKYPIKVLEERLKYERQSLEDEQGHIKTLKDQAIREEGHLMTHIARITGLEDALRKLKGLDNLEKHNKIAEPDSSDLKEKFKAKNTELEMLKSEREMLQNLLNQNKSNIKELIVHLEILAEEIKQK